MNIRNAKFMNDPAPIDSTCACQTCKSHSRSYIHHLFRVGELLGMQLLSLHNVATMTRLLRDVRQGIREGTLEQIKKEWIV